MNWLQRFVARLVLPPIAPQAPQASTASTAVMPRGGSRACTYTPRTGTWREIERILATNARPMLTTEIVSQLSGGWQGITTVPACLSAMIKAGRLRKSRNMSHVKRGRSYFYALNTSWIAPRDGD